MHVKRYEAATLEAALAQVKAELGPEALILSTRTLQRGRNAFGLFSRRVVEVQAARERSEASLGPEHSMSEAFDEGPGRTNPGGRPERADFELEIRAELRALHTAVAELARSRPAPPATACGAEGLEGFEALGGRLIGAGIGSDTAARLVAGWRERRAVEPDLDLPTHMRRLLEPLCVPPRFADPPRVRLVVGAPGVGKTTSLAKLAARNEEGEREVALVALDHDRIGASDALRRYAALLEAPFVSSTDVGEVSRLADRMRRHEILVDSAGRGPRDDLRLETLVPLRERLGERAEVELVIDATARPEVHRAQLARFASLRPDRIIATHTDECAHSGPLVELLLTPGCPPIAWRGSGQRVPEDLEVVEPEALVRDVMGAAA